MNIEHLAAMANQIGTFFASMPDREQALADIALHLKRFWAPPMRTQLLDAVARGAAPLDPIVQEALAWHGDSLRPAGLPSARAA